MNTAGQPITQRDAIEIVERTATVKSRQDLLSAAALYHPEGVLETPTLAARSEGKEIPRALENWFAFAPDYTVTLDGYAMDGMTLCAWGKIAFTPTFTRAGRRPNGRKAESDVFILFQFRDGQIVWERFHFDLAAVARHCAFDPSDVVAA